MIERFNELESGEAILAMALSVLLGYLIAFFIHLAITCFSAVTIVIIAVILIVAALNVYSYLD